MADDIPTHAPSSLVAGGDAIPDGSAGPGSSSSPHPLDGIPLPAHGFETLDTPGAELATIPAVEVISRAAVLLMNASAQQLGLSPAAEPELDLPEARILITALAGLLAASQNRLGPHSEPLHDGLRTLQNAFREASSHPDAAGEGPGEQYLS